MDSELCPRIELGRGFQPLAQGVNHERFVLVEGPRGTGKTRAILSILLGRALRFEGSRWLLARSTRTRLTQTVLATLEEQVFPAHGIAVPGGGGRDNRSEYTLPNGSMLIPMGLDDPQRTTSAEFAGIYVAEAVEIESADLVTALAGSMRQAIPPDAKGVPLRHQCIVDCNPGAPGHWLNKIAEHVPPELRRVRTSDDYRRVLRHNQRPSAGGWKRLLTRLQDNPHFWNMPAWDYTEAGRQYLESLGYLAGHLKARWVDGDWVAAEGSVFPEFTESRHVVAPFAIPPEWPIVWWYDSGYDHPTGIVWAAVAPNGCLYIVADHKVRGHDVAWHADSVKRRETEAGWTIDQRYGDPQTVFSHTAGDPEGLASQWSRLGIRIAPGPRSTDAERMVERVRERLVAGTLKVFATCRDLIDEFQSWRYKRNAKGEQLKGDDQYEDANNDLLDGVRGLCCVPLPTQRGRSVIILEEEDRPLKAVRRIPRG